MVTVTELNRAPDGRFESLQAITLLGADVGNATENQILVTQGDGTLAAETQAQGPNPYDQAQTFSESDLSLTLTKTAVSNGSIKLSDTAGTTATRVSDGSSFSSSGGFGLEIVPQTDLLGVTVEVSGNTDGAQDVFIVDSNETILDEKTNGYTGGDTVTLDASLSSGTSYYVGTFNDGGGYTVGRNTSPSYPYTSSDVDITAGANGIHPDDGNSLNTDTNAYSIVSVTGLTEVTSGSAVIEWDRGIPTDIFEWDVATFTRTLDGETVDVYVAYSSDGGSTWTRTNSGNPITRNYSLNEDANITPSEDVRIEAELSRADTSNNPTLDSAYRSWLV